jgi:hypothetical protein
MGIPRARPDVLSPEAVVDREVEVQGAVDAPAVPGAPLAADGAQDPERGGDALPRPA